MHCPLHDVPTLSQSLHLFPDTLYNPAGQLFLLKLEQTNAVGAGVGLRVGDVEGAFEGGCVGRTGLPVGPVVGDDEGALEGIGVAGTGGGVGPRVGDSVGAVGEEVGDLEGLDDAASPPLKVFVPEDAKSPPVATSTPSYMIL